MVGGGRGAGDAPPWRSAARQPSTSPRNAKASRARRSVPPMGAAVAAPDAVPLARTARSRSQLCFGSGRSVVVAVPAARCSARRDRRIDIEIDADEPLLPAQPWRQDAFRRRGRRQARASSSLTAAVEARDLVSPAPLRGKIGTARAAAGHPLGFGNSGIAGRPRAPGPRDDREKRRRRGKPPSPQMHLAS